MLCLFLPCFFLLIFRFRFTIAKVQHLEIPFPLFAAFCRFLSRLQVQNQDEKVVYLTEN